MDTNKRILLLPTVLSMLIALVLFLASHTEVYAADDTESGNSSEEYTQIDGTTYFYDQFDNGAYRTIYKQINQAASEFDSSDTNASYNDGGYYAAFELSIDNKDWEVVGTNGMAQIVNSVIADHPEYFWMSDSYICEQKSSGELRYTALTIECYGLYANGKTRAVYKNNFDLTINEYAAALPENAKDYEKAYLIHNAIINKTYYAESITSKDSENVYAYTADGVFNSKYRSAVTYGYAKAFKAIMDYVGVPCIYIEGQNQTLLEAATDTENETANTDDTTNNCAWNAIYLDGEWYLINVGLDDPVTSTGKNALSYDYFNITDAQASNLTALTDRLPGIPECTGTTYNLTRVQEDLQADGLWENSSYNFIDRMLDKYGLSVVLISTGFILLLIVAFIKQLHKKGKERRKEKVKKTKTTVLDNSELDEELRKPPVV